MEFSIKRVRITALALRITDTEGVQPPPPLEGYAITLGCF